jgi:nitrous oxide reductase accessory protein NosL
MMQKFYGLVFLSIIAFAHTTSQNFPYLQSGNYKYWCPITGENLAQHSKTNYSAKLTSGTQRQYSSLFGLYFDTKEYGILQSSIQKYDEKKKGFIPVKWGEIKYNENDFAKDKKWNENIKIKKFYKMGKKVYIAQCKKNQLDLENFLEINELKGYLVETNLCGHLDEKYLHPLSIYLWDVQKLGRTQNKNIVVVHEDEKCPVCGMFVSKYPKWATKLYFGEKSYSFDGVKDLIKFYFNPLKWGKFSNAPKEKVTKFEVTDYYTQNAIDGFKAFYVIRSDVYGPMGHEFIPFINEADAKAFISDHNGKKILRFEEIEEKMAYELDTNGK